MGDSTCPVSEEELIVGANVFPDANHEEWAGVAPALQPEAAAEAAVPPPAALSAAASPAAAAAVDGNFLYDAPSVLDIDQLYTLLRYTQSASTWKL